MSKMILSAQDFSIYKGDGLDPQARTGAISCEHLFRAGAEGVIVGHSEVGDTVQVVRQKLLTLVDKAGGDLDFLSKSTVLVGESWEEFESKSTAEVAEIIAKQINTVLQDLPKEFVRNLVIGYEPKWGSRGSGRDDMPPPAPELIGQCAKKIHEQLKLDFGEDTAKSVPIIYGGRSTPERTEQILVDPYVEGLILGSACNTVEKTISIASAMQKVMGSKRKVLHANFKAYNLSDSYEDYIKALQELDDTFIVYLSPSHTDLFQLSKLLKEESGGR